MSDNQRSVLKRPGDLMRELLQAADITQTELASALGRPVKTISEIATGRAAVTPETAIQFEQFFDIPAEVWLMLEMHYRLHTARGLLEGVNG